MLRACLYPLYVIRRVIFALYQLLVFISKPAARWLLPLGMIGLAGWQSEAVTAFIGHPSVMGRLQRWIPLPPSEVELYAILTLAGLIVLLLLFSWVLRPFLGAFPPMRRPLPPARVLKARNLIKKPAPVSIAVPALKHQFKAEHQDDMIAALPPAVQMVLQTPQKSQEASEAIAHVQSSLRPGVTPQKSEERSMHEPEQQSPPAAVQPPSIETQPAMPPAAPHKRERPPPPPRPPMPKQAHPKAAFGPLPSDPALGEPEP